MRKVQEQICMERQIDTYRQIFKEYIQSGKDRDDRYIGSSSSISSSIHIDTLATQSKMTTSRIAEKEK